MILRDLRIHSNWMRKQRKKLGKCVHGGTHGFLTKCENVIRKNTLPYIKIKKNSLNLRTNYELIDVDVRIHRELAFFIYMFSNLIKLDDKLRRDIRKNNILRKKT